MNLYIIFHFPWCDSKCAPHRAIIQSNWLDLYHQLDQSIHFPTRNLRSYERISLTICLRVSSIQAPAPPEQEYYLLQRKMVVYDCVLIIGSSTQSPTRTVIQSLQWAIFSLFSTVLLSSPRKIFAMHTILSTSKRVKNISHVSEPVLVVSSTWLCLLDSPMLQLHFKP